MDSATGDTEDTPSAVARQLLERVRREQPTEAHEQALAAFDERALTEIRTDRQTALAFWLNVYNAGAQLLLDRRPALFESRWRFFRATAVTVAGIDVSLDDIEHGLMRNRQSKYGLGYLSRLARCGFDAAYRLPVDPRIHFALNCGAASCPAILSYDAATVDQALDDATEQYLAQHVHYDAATDRVRVPRVCLWFIGDFGGPAGLRAFLRDYGRIPRGASPSLSFDGYDWTRVPRRFDMGE